MTPTTPTSSADELPFDPQVVDTPALVLDEDAMTSSARSLAELAHGAGCRMLYSVKALSVPGVLQRLAALLDGFSVSSLFEARLAREVLGDKGALHFVSPALRERDAAEIAELCDLVSFNSISQWERLGAISRRSAACGLRVNPGVSFVRDVRYDPCRPGSKLGIAPDQLPIGAACGLGLHLHNNCESTRMADLTDTLQHLSDRRPDLVEDAAWLNLGGGYLFDEAEDLDQLATLAGQVSRRGARPVYLEPGAALVQAAGYLVTSVLDCFESDGQQVAVLDTSVNHLPEVFEYQYRPTLAGAAESGPYRYTLAGASCLAGDLLGSYAFAEPLEPGTRLVIFDAGSYSLVKAQMFNGINLPTLYRIAGGAISEQRRFGYADYLDRCGGIR